MLRSPPTSRFLARSNVLRVLLGALVGLFVGPTLTILMGALLCGIQKGGPMYEAPDFWRGALFGMLFFWRGLGIPSAVVGSIIGATIGVMGRNRSRLFLHSPEARQTKAKSGH